MLAASGCVFAQQAPDAGSLLREQLNTAPALPARDAPVIQSDDESAPSTAADTGSVQFVVTSIRISGSSIFSPEELQALVHDLIGQPAGFAELQAAAARISNLYRSRGYPVARAYLPAQDIVDGAVLISVTEGQFGRFKLNNGSHIDDSAVRYRLEALSGQVISTAALERVLLLLNDLPGVGSVHAALMPGTDNGVSDIAVDLESEPYLSGSIEGDNFGNRYVGANQVTAKLNIDSPLRIGDALGVQFTRSDDEMAFRRLSYQLPLGNRGLELGTSYVAARYRLGRQFAALDASGDSTSYTLSASYPLVRTAGFSLYGRAIGAWREFEDRTLATALVDNKSSDAVTLMLNGSNFDTIGSGGGGRGGGTSFALAYTGGRLNIEAPITRAIDDTTAGTHGRFHKWNVQLLRLQNLGDRTSAYFSFIGQKAGDNLDSAEKFILGGANGVRAYPQGEAPGDSGYIATAELRYQLTTNSTWGSLQPFVLIDAGAVTVSETRFADGTNHRRLSGWGAGIAWFGAGGPTVKLTVARRFGHEPVLSDDDRSTRLWAQAAWHF